MILVLSYRAFDVAIVRRHHDRPRLAIATDAASGFTLGVLHSDAKTVDPDVVLGVIAGVLLSLRRRVIYVAAVDAATMCPLRDRHDVLLAHQPARERISLRSLQ